MTIEHRSDSRDDEYADFRERLAQLLEHDELLKRRLPKAHTTVTFLVTDAQEESFELLLDRRPPEVGDATNDAEATVRLSHDQLIRFAAGRFLIANALLDGELTWSGPIRKYLAVDAILRGGLRRADEEDA